MPKIMDCGADAWRYSSWVPLKGTKYSRYSSVATSLLNDLALNATIFVGNEISSWSSDFDSNTVQCGWPKKLQIFTKRNSSLDIRRDEPTTWTYLLVAYETRKFRLENDSTMYKLYVGFSSRYLDDDWLNSPPVQFPLKDSVQDNQTTPKATLGCVKNKKLFKKNLTAIWKRRSLNYDPYPFCSNRDRSHE